MGKEIRSLSLVEFELMTCQVHLIQPHDFSLCPLGVSQLHPHLQRKKQSHGQIKSKTRKLIYS